MYGVYIESVRLCDDEMEERRVRREATFDRIRH